MLQEMQIIKVVSTAESKKRKTRLDVAVTGLVVLALVPNNVPD